jgi:hypothetical protein
VIYRLSGNLVVLHGRNWPADMVRMKGKELHPTNNHHGADQEGSL